MPGGADRNVLAMEPGTSGRFLSAYDAALGRSPPPFRQRPRESGGLLSGEAP